MSEVVIQHHPAAGTGPGGAPCALSWQTFPVSTGKLCHSLCAFPLRSGAAAVKSAIRL